MFVLAAAGDQTNNLVHQMLDVSRLTEFQQRSLDQALDGLERLPPEVLPQQEKFWRGVQAGVRLVAAAEGMDDKAAGWIANEFLRRLRGVPYIEPAGIRRKQAPIVVAGLYHHLGRVTFEVLRDWHASAKKV